MPFFPSGTRIRGASFRLDGTPPIPPHPFFLPDVNQSDCAPSSCPPCSHLFLTITPFSMSTRTKHRLLNPSPLSLPPPLLPDGKPRVPSPASLLSPGHLLQPYKVVERSRKIQMASPAGSIKIEGHNGTRSIPRTVVDSDFPEKSQGLVSAKVRIERTSPEEAQESRRARERRCTRQAKFEGGTWQGAG